MSRASVLAASRRFAERGMRDACRITRSTTATTDPATGVVTRTPEVVYEGRCRLQLPGVAGVASGTEDSIAAADVRILSPQLQLPMATSTGIRAGDVVEMTQARTDPDLTGRTYTVAGEFSKSEATARRLGLKEVTG